MAKCGGTVTGPKTVHPDADDASLFHHVWWDSRQGGPPAASRSTVLNRSAQVWSSGGSKEAETKVGQEIQDLANDLLKSWTECADPNYRDCKRANLPQEVSTEAPPKASNGTKAHLKILAYYETDATEVSQGDQLWDRREGKVEFRTEEAVADVVQNMQLCNLMWDTF